MLGTPIANVQGILQVPANMSQPLAISIVVPSFNSHATWPTSGYTHTLLCHYTIVWHPETEITVKFGL